MKTDLVKYIIATFTAGIGMWIVAGLWHNLVLPMLDKRIEAHHEGLLLMLIA